jgi:hypothetical protein
VTTLTVTPAQAQKLAAALNVARDAQARAQDVLDTLTAGHPLDAGAVLADVNTDTGVLTFHVARGDASTEGTDDAG